VDRVTLPASDDSDTIENRITCWRHYVDAKQDFYRDRGADDFDIFHEWSRGERLIWEGRDPQEPEPPQAPSSHIEDLN